LEELKWEKRIGAAPATTVSPAHPAGSTLGVPSFAEDADPVLAVIGYDPVDLDTLATRSGLAPEALLARLLPLELDGRIAQLPGGRYQRLD
jgi:DNA processing protein